MRAIVYTQYGPPETLALAQIAQPVPTDGEMLVRVSACSVNPGDWDVLHGTPYVLRASTGFRKPKHQVLGLAVAGRVESIGPNVTKFAVGDAIFAGIPRGGFAEFARVPAATAAPKPFSLTYEQAAAIPVAGTTALQALRNVGRVEAGQQVLVNGASGGVGTFAVQIAKALGAEVTGVCSTRNVDLVRSLGADHVVDYTREDFAAGDRRYDLILDNVGNRSLADLRRALEPKGMLIPNSNKGGGRWLGGYLPRAFRALVVSPFASQRLRPFAASDKSEDLAALTELIEAKAVTPVIDRTYPLQETANALAYYGEGHPRGKIVITVDHE